MTSKALTKLVDALNQMMESYAELQQAVEDDIGGANDDEDTVSSEVDAAVVHEVRSALETLVENDDYSIEEVAAVLSSLTDALQELDPDVFEDEEDADEDEESESEDEDLDDEDADDDFDDSDE